MITEDSSPRAKSAAVCSHFSGNVSTFRTIHFSCGDVTREALDVRGLSVMVPPPDDASPADVDVSTISRAIV